MRIFLFCLIGLIAPVAHAQSSENVRPADDGKGFPIYITVTVQGIIMDEHNAEPLPVPLLSLLFSDTHLGRFDLNSNTTDDTHRYYAQYVFHSTTEMEAWYDQPSVKTMFSTLKRLGRQSPSIAVNMKRMAYREAFGENQ